MEISIDGELSEAPATIGMNHIKNLLQTPIYGQVGMLQNYQEARAANDRDGQASIFETLKHLFRIKWWTSNIKIYALKTLTPAMENFVRIMS